jgi:hypothetical protein
MSKQYAFWRNSHGGPASRGKSKNGPTSLLAHHGKTASVTSEGKVAFRLESLFHRTEIALRSSSMVLDPGGKELNSTDSWSIFSQAIKSTIKTSGGGKPINSDELLNEADRIASEFFRKKTDDYHLLTSLSVNEFPAPEIRVGGCVISPVRRIGRFKMPEGIDRAIRLSELKKEWRPVGHQAVKVSVNGRSEYDAADKAIGALNILRSIWTLAATFGSMTIRLDATMRPHSLGIIQIGPIQTLHHLDGTPVGSGYWYEPEFRDDKNVFAPSKGWDRVEKLRRLTQRRLRTCAYAADLETLLIRYVKACDHLDHDTSFLQLWSILEKIANSIGADYDEVIRRVTWIFKNRPYNKQVLEALRIHRNQYIHSAKSSEAQDQLVYALKMYVDHHLLRLIRNDYEVNSLAEYAEVISQSSETAIIKRQLKHRKIAMKMLGKDDESKSE